MTLALFYSEISVYLLLFGAHDQKSVLTHLAKKCCKNTIYTSNSTTGTQEMLRGRCKASYSSFIGFIHVVKLRYPTMFLYLAMHYNLHIV